VLKFPKMSPIDSSGAKSTASAAITTFGRLADGQHLKRLGMAVGLRYIS